MKQINQSTVLMTTLMLLLALSPFISILPAYATTEYDLRGTWTFVYDPDGETTTHIMIINVFDDGTGAFRGIGRQKDDLTVTWNITGIERGNTVIFTIEYTGINEGNYLVEDAEGTVFPGIPGDPDKPTRMVDSINTPIMWVATRRLDRVFDPRDEIQVRFPDDSNIVNVFAQPEENDGSVYDYLDDAEVIYTINVQGPPRKLPFLGTGLVPLCIRLEYVPPQPRQLYMVQFILLGDVDHDGIVHQRDASRVIRAMFTRPGDKKWDRNADIDHDRQITMDDLTIVLENMWETEKQWVRIPSLVLIVDVGPPGLGGDDFVVVCGFPDHFSGWGIRR
jgi:hypothetical protein